jgi:hypothetical protein
MSEQTVQSPERIDTVQGAVQEPIAEQQKPRSGYARLRVRHRSLIAAHQQLTREHQELLDSQAALQGDIDRLLKEHRRLMQNAKTGGPVQPWFESANKVLAQLAVAPEPRALQVMTAAVASIQQRLAQIIMRVPVP